MVGDVVAVDVLVDVLVAVCVDVCVVDREVVAVDVAVVVWVDVPVLVGDVLVVGDVVRVDVAVVRSQSSNWPALKALMAALTSSTLAGQWPSSLRRPSTSEHTIDVLPTAPKVNSFAREANAFWMAPLFDTFVAWRT